MMAEQGLVKKSARVKVLGRGEIAKALQVTAHAFSDSAKAKIAAAGGQVTELGVTRGPRTGR